MRAGLVVAGIMMVAATVAYAEEWPVRLEEIWTTPGNDEPVFVEGFPPPEIKAVLADTSIPQEDKEWLLNQIRHWAAYLTKKLWLDDGSTMEIPAVRPGDKVSTFTVYASRNMKYWLVRAMRIEGPEVPPKPTVESVEEAKDPSFWEQMAAHSAAEWAQKAHWREVYMDVTGRIYWEKEFGPYDTHLEYEWYGAMGAAISDDGEVVVKRGGGKSWLCSKAGSCIEGREYVASLLSEDGSTIVTHSGPRSSGLTAYDGSGRVRWTSERVEGKVLSPTVRGMVVGVSRHGRASVFSTATSDSGMPLEWVVCLLGPDGKTVRKWEVADEPAGAAFAEEGYRLLLLTAYSLAMFDANDGSELWRYRADSRLTRLVATEGGMAVVCSRDGELLVLGREGDLLLRTQRTCSETSVSPNGMLLLEKAGALKFSRLAFHE